MRVRSTLSGSTIRGEIWSQRYVVRQSTYLMIIAMGQMIVLLTAGLDLSLGSLIGLVSVVSAMVMAPYAEGTPDLIIWGCVLGVLAGLGVAVLVGLINGIGVAFLNVPPFMMTLGMLSSLFGVALLISGGSSIYGLPEVFSKYFGFGRLFEIPAPLYFTAALFLLVYVLLVQTCIVHLIRHSMNFASWKDRKHVAKALRDVYRAKDADAGLAALDAFEAGPWGEKYPAIAQSWRRNWEHVSPFFVFPEAVRRIVYTTNAIESLNAKIRRAVRTRGHFPSDEAASKLLYLVLDHAAETWKRPPRVAHPVPWTQVCLTRRA